MAPMRLNFLPLDGGDSLRMFILQVEETWELSELREALEKSIFKGEHLARIKVWVVTQYLDVHNPHPSDLDTELPAYKNVPLVKVAPLTTIVSYFSEPFKPGEENKIHLIVKLGPITPSNSKNSDIAQTARDSTDEPQAKRQRVGGLYNLFIHRTTDALHLAALDAHARWKKFWDGLWGKGEAYLDTNIITEQQTEFGAFNTMSVDPAFKLSLRKLLIREEWREMWIYAVEQQKQGMQNFIMIGHPGIGKTSSLYYFLVMRVAFGLPTFFQFEPRFVLFFHTGGVDTIDPLQQWENVISASYDNEVTWAPYSWTTLLKSYGGLMHQHAPTFIVEASSPRGCHWKWTKDHGFTMQYYMEPFSLQEMLQDCPEGNTIQAEPASEMSIRSFYVDYGPSARDCYFAARSGECLGSHDRMVKQSIERMSWDRLILLISSKDLTPSHADDNSAPSHYIVLIEPLDNKRYDAKVNVITRTVMRRLWMAHRRHIQLKITELYDIFSRHAGSSVTAGWLFEGFVHDLLEAGIEKPLHKLGLKSNNSSNAIYDSYIFPNSRSTAQWKSQKMEYVPFTEVNPQLDLLQVHL